MKKALFPIILILTLACTVGIYYLIFDQHNHLFYINVVSTCVAEILLLLNIPMWSGKKLLNITNATASIFTNLYAVAIFVWTLLYSLTIHNVAEESFKTYYIGILIATLLFVVFCGIASIGAHTAEEGAKEQEKLVENRRSLIEFVRVLDIDIQSSLEREDSEWKDHFSQLYQLLSDKLSSFPNEKLHKNPNIAQKVENDLTEIATLCDQLATSDNRAYLQANITNKLNKLIKYVTTVKTL